MKYSHKPAQIILCYVFVFFAIFGVKLDLFDLSIIIPGLVLVLIVISSKRFLLNRDLILVAEMIMFLLCYQGIIQAIFSNFEFSSLLRLARATIFCVFLAILIGSRLFSTSQLISSIYYSLLLHAGLLSSAAMLPPLNEFLGDVSGNDRVSYLRASGLLAGFDIAGLTCLIGVMMLFMGIYRHRSRVANALATVVFSFACYFTSRVTIALLMVMVFMFLLIYLLKGNAGLPKKLVVVTLLSSAFGFAFYKYVFPIFDITFSLDYLDISREVKDDIISRNAVQSSNEFLWSSMFFLPEGAIGKVFGTGSETLFSDVGYVKDVYRYGMVGLIFSFFIYFKIYFLKLGLIRKDRDNRGRAFMWLIFLLTFALSLKNGYFFTRSIFPLTLLLVAAFMQAGANERQC